VSFDDFLHQPLHVLLTPKFDFVPKIYTGNYFSKRF
jgi:hypothetical protein